MSQSTETEGSTQGQVHDLLKLWPVGNASAVDADTSGTINRTWIVSTDAGRYALRMSLHADAESTSQECELIRRVADAGFPAVRPVQTQSGEDFAAIEGQIWTLFPFAPGSQVDRTDMTPAQDRGMGRGLARLFAALATCPRLGRDKRFDVDAETTLAEIARFERLIRDIPVPHETDTWSLERLEGRRRWVEANGSDTSGLDDLPKQMIHGDYQEKNVFFDDSGEVVALIDWDNARWAPREWELVRTLNLVMDFDPARGVTFLEGFRETERVDVDGLDRAAWAYGLVATHSLWLLEAIYDEGNGRLRRFVRPGPFKPAYDRWLPLRKVLMATA